MPRPPLLYVRAECGSFNAAMQLTLQSHNVGEVVVVRCRGRIVSGDEVRFLQLELDKLTELTKNVILQLDEVSYLDSGGLGALVRIFGVLRAAGGDLKLCQLSPFVVQVLQATNLLSVFHPYASEKEAIEAFSARPQSPDEISKISSARVVCLDTSLDLLAYLKVLLQRSGYEVFATRYPSDAIALVIGTKPRLVVCGPSMTANESTIEKFRQTAPHVPLLHLPPDFSTSEADRAGLDLVNRIRSLLAPS
ncbi:MAG: STAS domain-containing protein [Candidatus Acidiferrales bacterium]